MSENRPFDLPPPADAFDAGPAMSALSPADAAVLGGLVYPLPPPFEDRSASAQPTVGPVAATSAPPSGGGPKGKGKGNARGSVWLNGDTLCQLREAKCMSQEELVHDFERRNIRVSIATIKRAETGHAVRYRIVRELARYFGVSFDDLLH